MLASGAGGHIRDLGYPRISFSAASAGRWRARRSGGRHGSLREPISAYGLPPALREPATILAGRCASRRRAPGRNFRSSKRQARAARRRESAGSQAGGCPRRRLRPTKKRPAPEGTGLESFRRGCLKGPIFVQVRTELCKRKNAIPANIFVKHCKGV